MQRLIIAALIVSSLVIGPTGARAQEWLLNPSASRFHMQTVKANAIFETHQFTGLEGRVGKNGDASVKIDLMSVASGIDIRDVRMRFLLFETFKFPHAEVTAKLDMSQLEKVVSTTRITYPLTFTLDLHGFKREIQSPVTVTRISDKAVSVATAQPIIIPADSFGLVAGIGKLSEAVGGTPIATAASFTFDLTFETGESIPQIQAVLAETAKRRAIEVSAPISAEACETRFSVISTTGAIQFKTGSADLDASSEPMLNEVADIANRCPAARIEVTGHTDTVGTRDANQRLSETRARSVVNYLSRRGVATARIDSSGFGDSRPVKPNDTEANRAVNRRIEFRVKER